MDDGSLEHLFRDMMRAVAPVPTIPGYRLLARVGSGAFGTVYRARELRLERDVALKVLHPQPEVGPEAEERFLREARALARVSHPNVVTLYGVVEHEGLRALATEYIEGRPLEDLALEKGSFSAEQVIRIGVDLARALEAVHAAGIIHRDVKPTNIVVDGSGRIVLADFGLGARRGAGQQDGKGSPLAGTPVYMAPELLDGGQADARSDIYALGVVLYRLAAGRLPFDEDRLADLRSSIERGALEPPFELRGEPETGLWRAIQRALSADPHARFQTAGDMGTVLAALVEPTVSEPTRGPRKSIPVLAALLALALLGTAVVAWRPWAMKPESGAFHASARIEDVSQASGGKLSIGLEADKPVHVYLLGEDSRGRPYLLFPRTSEEAATATRAGRSFVLEGDELAEVLGSSTRSLLIVASREPIAPLIDSIPPRGTSSDTGKEGAPRLKPIAIRGLIRLLAEAGWMEDADDGRVEARPPLLSEVLPPLPRSAPARGGLWAAQHALAPGASSR